MRGGGAMIIVPKNLNPKLRKDLVHTNEHDFESLWIECNINNDVSNKKEQLINVSYNPNKALLNSFLEELSTSIDYAVTENTPKVTFKEIFDKTDYRVEELRKLISNSNWCLFYNQTCAEGMYTVFTNIIEKALRRCAPKKTVFIRNDKNELTIEQN